MAVQTWDAYFFQSRASGYHYDAPNFSNTQCTSLINAVQWKGITIIPAKIIVKKGKKCTDFITYKLYRYLIESKCKQCQIIALYQGSLNSSYFSASRISDYIRLVHHCARIEPTRGRKSFASIKSTRLPSGAGAISGIILSIEQTDHGVD